MVVVGVSLLLRNRSSPSCALRLRFPKMDIAMPEDLRHIRRLQHTQSSRDHTKLTTMRTRQVDLDSKVDSRSSSLKYIWAQI